MGIYGNGLNIRLVIREDHVNSLYVIINNGKTGESYCIGGNCEITNIDLFKKIYSIMKYELNLSILPFEQSYSFIKDRKGHDFRYSINTKKIDKNFGIKSNTDLNSSVKKTIKFYQAFNNFKDIFI